ncbi:Probable cytochrome P450 305a1 [Eumeta japonica]|uniref:Probable cytochrome P450 305a1 n=1 Tax=Eumeta variegata TaxID=151549 RepID=A0A4C1TEM1_EUMVA|nr:Probable cytochrome P450 305a1 [Eumeta japonica]
MGCDNLVQRKIKELGSQWNALSHIAKEYSTQVLGLKLGSELVVVVYGRRNIRRVLTEKEFDGRPDNFFVRLRCFGKRMGITFADGDLWNEHRKFTLKHLKNSGLGTTSMQKEIQREMLNIVRSIKENGPGVSSTTIFAPSVMNVLWKFTAAYSRSKQAGESLENRWSLSPMDTRNSVTQGETIPEQRLDSFLKLMSARSKAFNMAGGWLNRWPWLRFIFPESTGYSLIIKLNEELRNIIEVILFCEYAIKRTLPPLGRGLHGLFTNPGLASPQVILRAVYRLSDNLPCLFREEQLILICLDLLIAGSQTTSKVLEFAILTVLRNKSIQEKIIEEIDTTIGDEMPCWTHRHKLIYTSAFLLEVQRYYTIVPLIGPRRVLSDTEIDGFSIPKDSTVLVSIGDLHFDIELWDNPNEFKPERFIDENGKLIIPEYMLHFGLGVSFIKRLLDLKEVREICQPNGVGSFAEFLLVIRNRPDA